MHIPSLPKQSTGNGVSYLLSGFRRFVLWVRYVVSAAEGNRKHAARSGRCLTKAPAAVDLNSCIRHGRSVHILCLLAVNRQTDPALTGGTQRMTPYMSSGIAMPPYVTCRRPFGKLTNVDKSRQAFRQSLHAGLRSRAETQATQVGTTAAIFSTARTRDIQQQTQLVKNRRLMVSNLPMTCSLSLSVRLPI